MGGQGSGRPPSAETLINRAQDEKRTPIGTEMFLPNFSVVQPAALRTSPAMISSETDPKFMQLSGSLPYLLTSLSGSISNYLPMTLSGSLAYLPMPLSGSTAISNNAIIYVSGSKYYGNNNLLTISGSNVGIGTTSPNTKLSLGSTTEDTAGSKIAVFETATTNVYGIGLSKGSDYGLGLFASTSTTGTPQMFIQRTTGNVGIGTTNPAQALHIKGNLQVSGSLTLEVSGSKYYSPVANEPSLGTLHLFAAEPTTWNAISNGQSSTWANIDVSALVPVGTTAVLLGCVVDMVAAGVTSTNTQLFLRKGGSSSDLVPPSISFQINPPISGTNYQSYAGDYIVGVDNSRIFQYKSAWTDVTTHGVYAIVKGYYI